MNRQEQLEKLHTLELKIAKEIKRICEKNGINYFLTAGTVLGAVRHKGFIPWDDDMDIGMLRADYNKFIEACKEDLGSEFFFQTWDTDKEYPFSFGKIRLNNTSFIEKFSENCGAHNGIFVDVFPYDNVPDSVLKRKIQGKKYFICKRILWMKKGMGENMKEASLIKRIKHYIFKVFSSFFKYESVKEYFGKIQVKYNDVTTKRVVTDGSYSFDKESIDREIVTNLESIQFEDEKFLAYVDRVQYLKKFYGNFMELPPEEERDRHIIQKVDFGPYV